MAPPLDGNSLKPARAPNSLSASFDSPGSSVFDLPTHSTEAGPARITPLPPPATITQAPESSPDAKASASPASYIVISGGTGGNAICSGFGNACFVLPVSDDGGSSSEIIRVLGGPSVGDIRSRLVRLIPHRRVLNSPLYAIRNLLAYRLPAKCTAKEAREEWRDIIEGRSPLWKGIPNDRKETIRGFLVYFESELLKRAQKNFDFRNGSIGNYFLAAAQGFFRSLPSAIFLFSSITNSQAYILPVIVTNHTVTIAAELEDGQRLVGQCEISHPVAATASELTFSRPDDLASLDGMGSLGELESQNIMYEQDKDKPFEPLPARLSRLYYINSYGMEIRPSPNPDFLANLEARDVLVYSCGSLWTSIMPCLSLRGVARAIASSRTLQAKVLLLNTENDRETEGYTAVDYINAIVRTLNTNYSEQQYGLGNANTTYPASAFITDLVYLKGSKVNVNEGAIRRLGINCTEATSTASGAESLRFDAEIVRVILAKMLSLIPCPITTIVLAFEETALSMTTSMLITPSASNLAGRVPTPDLPSDPIHKLQSSQHGLQGPQVLDVTQSDTPADIEVFIQGLGGDAKHQDDDVDGGVGVDIDGASSDGDESDDERDDSDEEDLRKLGASLSSSCGRVTFRPRVRIASGISRTHRKSGQQPHPIDELTYRDILSACSSRSCSPSSSISVPLRFHSEETETSKPGWGTLGQRVGLLARRSEHKRRFKDRMKQHERMLKSFQGVHRMHHSSLRRPSYSDETRPLLDPRHAQYMCQCGIAGCQYDERRIVEEIDMLFGKWPIRLFNPKWWWWHIQPIVFCRWLDDPEDEY